MQSKSQRQTYTDDPVGFSKEVLTTPPWGRQADIIKAVAKYPRVSVRSGHKIGKSTSAAILALWWASTKPGGRVVMTATTNQQVRNILWKELKRLAHRATIPLPRPAQLPSLGMQWPDGREIIGFSTKESERMAGLSGANMLFIVDEASGVAEDIYEAIEGNRAGGAHILMIGNPTQPVGTFYDSFHSKTEFWHAMHVSSVQASKARPHIPGIATKAWCNEKLREWGQEDPRYQVRVLGNFADTATCSVVPLGVLSLSQDSYDDMPVPSSRLEMGVDVARFGDDETVIACRRGNKLLSMTARSNMDEHEVADLVLRIAADNHRAGEGKPLVKVDACGVGLGVVSILRQKESVQVLGVNAADPSSMPDEFPNVRSQLWFAVADWLRDGGSIPKDTKLEADLLSAQYDFDARGRRRVEKKESIKARLHRSPDRADALALAVYTPRARLVSSSSLQRSQSRASNYRFGNTKGY